MILEYPFTGAVRFYADLLQEGHQLPVALPCRIDDWPTPLHAMLDTGARWCLMPPFVARGIGYDPTPDPETPALSTRLGSFRGRLERARVTFHAQEGADLIVEATFFLCEDWPGPPVIGWSGCLERLRFAVHPLPEDPSFCFAPL